MLPPPPHHPADSTVPTAATEASAPSWPQAGLLGGVWLRPVALWGAGAGLGGTGSLERSWASSTISTILWVEPIKPSQRRGCPPRLRRSTSTVFEGYGLCPSGCEGGSPVPSRARWGSQELLASWKSVRRLHDGLSPGNPNFTENFTSERSSCLTSRWHAVWMEGPVLLVCKPAVAAPPEGREKTLAGAGRCGPAGAF